MRKDGLAECPAGDSERLTGIKARAGSVVINPAIACTATAHEL